MLYSLNCHSEAPRPGVKTIRQLSCRGKLFVFYGSLNWRQRDHASLPSSMLWQLIDTPHPWPAHMIEAIFGSKVSSSFLMGSPPQNQWSGQGQQLGCCEVGCWACFQQFAQLININARLPLGPVDHCHWQQALQFSMLLQHFAAVD